jgi:hypothetical protein
MVLLISGEPPSINGHLIQQHGALLHRPSFISAPKTSAIMKSITILASSVLVSALVTSATPVVSPDGAAVIARAREPV